MQFEEIQKQKSELSEFWRPPVPQEKQSHDLLLLWLKDLPITNIAELGVGSGYLGNNLLAENKTAKYNGYELNPQALRATATQYPKLTLHSAPLSCEIALPDASQDLFLCAYMLEFLRMDQFYMACSEARRLVKAGKFWGIINLSQPQTLQEKFAAFTRRQLAQLQPKWISSAKVIDINHYISPEDWEVAKQTKINSWGSFAQITLLKRL